MAEETALGTWCEKIEFFRQEEATCSDPEQKFKLKKGIEEAQAKIDELLRESEIEDTDTLTNSTSMPHRSPAASDSTSSGAPAASSAETPSLAPEYPKKASNRSFELIEQLTLSEAGLLCLTGSSYSTSRLEERLRKHYGLIEMLAHALVKDDTDDSVNILWKERRDSHDQLEKEIRRAWDLQGAEAALRSPGAARYRRGF